MWIVLLGVRIGIFLALQIVRVKFLLTHGMVSQLLEVGVELDELLLVVGGDGVHGKLLGGQVVPHSLSAENRIFSEGSSLVRGSGKRHYKNQD